MMTDYINREKLYAERTDTEYNDCQSCDYNENGFCVYYGWPITSNIYRVITSLGFPHFKKRKDQE